MHVCAHLVNILVFLQFAYFCHMWLLFCAMTVIELLLEIVLCVVVTPTTTVFSCSPVQLQDLVRVLLIVFAFQRGLAD
jgi:hypothetical protein